VDDFVHFAKGLAQFGVEVVFDAVVATKWWNRYRPPNLLPIMAHLLPS
jgi:hypothetical protein